MFARSEHEGIPILKYKTDKKTYSYVDLLQAPVHSTASRFHAAHALKIAATSVACSFSSSNDPGIRKSDQAQSAATVRSPS